MDKNIDFFNIKYKSVSPRQGKILIAEPRLADDYFNRAVIILTEHNENETIGFVLNNMVSVQLNEIIPDFPQFKATVSIGGPVAPNSIHFIHTLGNIIPETKCIGNNLYWGGDFDIVTHLISQGKINPQQIRFFLGYSGWGENQLVNEIKENSWVVSELDVVQIMAGKENLWSRAVQQMGPRFKPWTIYPASPLLN
ncbi:MAG: YqgE/AlgH family protein [Bacteroidales bacterium]|nr:YqgE/AlgH family protein [Bacteroidales bacterium]MDD4673824.1 YqgE/AlgH family protein [Bacteroidales bacterium]